MVHRRYLVAWLGLLAVADANGALRAATFGKIMSELSAHQLSTLIGSAALGIAIWFIVRRWPPSSDREALTVGLVWVALTVAFEFFMELVLAGESLSHALAAYNVPAGRVCVFLLLWIALAPLLFHRLGVTKAGRAT